MVRLGSGIGDGRCHHEAVAEESGQHYHNLSPGPGCITF